MGKRHNWRRRPQPPRQTDEKGAGGPHGPRGTALNPRMGTGRLCPLCQDTLFYGKHISKTMFSNRPMSRASPRCRIYRNSSEKECGALANGGGNQAQRAHKSCSQVSPVSGHDAETGDGHTAQIPQSSSGTERRRRAGTAPNSTSDHSSFRRL